VEKYLDRTSSAEHLTEKRGVRTTVQHLANLASRGLGPRYVLINGRALSTGKWLDEWVDAEAARPLRGRGHRKSKESAAA
jgi:hypothetical protein